MNIFGGLAFGAWANQNLARKHGLQGEE